MWVKRGMWERRMRDTWPAAAATTVSRMTHLDPTAGFYDDLAADYHLIFADWDEAISRQSRVITNLLRDISDMTSGTVLDASCGIGTQALGLAAAGFVVTATDISAASVKRCAHEAVQRGLELTTAVADLRTLEVGQFDAVLSFDNALPHLLDDADLNAACGSLRRALQPGGLLLASVRDYDALLEARPSGDLPRRFVNTSGERIVFQLWDWVSEDRYDVRHFIMDSRDAGYSVSERRTNYRALSRAVLSRALTAVGFHEVTWRMPTETGFYQPVVTARAPG